MKIYLIGYMGSGKSTLGKELAEVLGLPWMDLDAEFENKYKISIPDFFKKYGETTFRELEHKLLLDISVVPDSVISTGGGTPCYHGNMLHMNQNGFTIYLHASAELILARIQPSAWKRPLFQQMEGEDSLQKIRWHLNTRQEYYEMAKMTIDATKPDVQDLKNTILNYREIIT